MSYLMKFQTSNPTHCYADDSTLHSKPSLPNNRNNVASSITLDLDKLYKWGSQNLVSFNTNKTQCCLISRSENKNFPDILFGSNTLKMCDSLSMLGVSVASDLSYNEHISSVAKSAARKISFLFRSKRFFTPLHLLTLYRAQSAFVSNAALIYEEEPLNILLLSWIQFKNEPSD